MRLLLHACCGPCAVYPVRQLLADGVDVVLLYANPNIQPQAEWALRLANLERVAETLSVPLWVSHDGDPNRWRHDDPKRCAMCYDVRLQTTSAWAKDKGFDAFSTTLLVSPYQNRDALLAAGRRHASATLPFLPYDWRPHFREGQDMAKAMGLYRQRFCGCLPSIEASRYRDAIKSRLAL